MESDLHEGDVTERVIPSENIQLMFHYRNPFVVCQSDNSFRKQPRSMISGLCNSFSDVSTNGNTGVVFISFFPTGACQFFDFPLSEVENLSIDLCDLLKEETVRIEEALSYADTLTGRVKVIEEFLTMRFAPIALYDQKIIGKGIDLIKCGKGQITATSLAEDLSLTTKSLERKFSQYLGKTTKQLVKLIRFHQVLQDLSFHKHVSLTEITYRNGYYDQSHFIRDFKTHTGYTPKEFTTRYPGFSVNAESC
jgi:AraC-like DNA-binding protein